MARVKRDNKLNVVIGTKAQIEGDTSIPENSIIVVTDEELKADEIVYSVEKNVKEAIDEKQDKLEPGNNITIDENNVISASGGEVDMNEMAYFDYAGSIYGAKYNLLADAWEHSLTVDVIDKDHYPDGATKGVIIPQGVTSIEAYAFNVWSSNNQPLVIPNSVTSIDFFAFNSWTNNTHPLVIPDSVKTIGINAFSGWESNNHPLIIPNSVISINSNAFASWSSVPYVEMKRTIPPTLTDINAFINQNDAPIYVPDESVDYYKSETNWEDLADRIFPISDKAVGASGGSDFHRVRIFSDNNKLVTTQMVQEGESLKEEYKLKNGYIFDYGTRNEFDYNTIITEDLDLTYSVIPPRYIQTTSADFNASGNYIGTGEYIILPADKPDGYKITDPYLKGVATNGDYLTSCQNMFYGHNSSYLELDYLDTSNVTNMSYMFSNSKATTLDLSSFDTSNVTVMNHMFWNSQATTLDLSNFNTSKVTTMASMFRNSNATTLVLSSFDTSSVKDMYSMFNTSKATTLDLSNFDTSNVTGMNSMFQTSYATTGYARTQTDADNFNSSSDKPSTLTFVVKEDITQVSGRVDWEDIENKPDLFSKDYNDLTNKPNIPENTSDLINDSDFTTTGYVDDKDTIKEQNKNTDIKFWTGSQTEYDSLIEKDENTLYFIEEE